MSDLIYGINPAREALRGGRRRPLELYLARGIDSRRIEELTREAATAGVPVRHREREDLDRLAGHRHHQGVLLRVEPFCYVSEEDLLAYWRDSSLPAFFLVLDGITDPHNLGALVRSADAAGCHGIFIPRDRACPITAVVDKASAGALEHIPLCQVTNVARTLEMLKGEGIWTYGLAGEEGENTLYAADLSGNVALVIGSEGKGMRANVRKHCDLLLSIPMAGGVASLNASVAGAVALFEAVRQRLKKNPDSG